MNVSLTLFLTVSLPDVQEPISTGEMAEVCHRIVKNRFAWNWKQYDRSLIDDLPSYIRETWVCRKFFFLISLLLFFICSTLHSSSHASCKR